MRNLIILTLLFPLLLPVNAAFAQATSRGSDRPGAHKKPQGAGQVVVAHVNDKDTLLLVTLEPVEIEGYRIRKFANDNERKRFYRLVYDVRKVYPMSKTAGELLRGYNEKIVHIKTRSRRRKYIKQMEKELKDQYEDEIENMSYRQGRILIRLIDRETGDTSYKIIKELRGSFSAFFWQGIARIFGNNLKWEYGDSEEDEMIEEIIQLIDAGVL